MKKSFWLKKGVLISLITGVALLCSYVPAVQRLENPLFDISVHFQSQPGGESPVVAVAIDADSTRSHPWPWSSDQLAALIQNIQKAHPRVIGLLHTPSASSPSLARALHAGNTVLAAPVTAAFRHHNRAALKKNTIGIPDKILPYFSFLNPLFFQPEEFTPAVWMPAAIYTQNAKAVGGVLETDISASRRHSNLLYTTNAGTLPSFSLQVFTHSQPGRLSWKTGPELAIGNHVLYTDSQYRVYPQPLPGRRDQVELTTVPASEVTGHGAKTKLKNKIVIVGVTDKYQSAMITDALGREISPLHWQAQIITSLALNSYVHKPNWFYGVQRVSLLVLALLLFYMPARWFNRSGFFLILFNLILLVNVTFFVLYFYKIWSPVILPALFALLGFIVLGMRQHYYGALEKAHAESGQARSCLADHYQNLGQLDRALEEFLKCPDGYDNHEKLYDLALDFERRRQFSKALNVYQRISASHPEFRDIGERLERLRAAPKIPMAGMAGKSPAADTVKTMVMNNPVHEKPVIGRFQLIEELGRGAMGVVYLAMDPKIDRKLAIKVLDLTQEFEDDVIEDVQLRFFREARAAGRLQHPNIITIYDAGEENGLAYIVMDYATGKSLESYIEPDTLLPIDDILTIVTEVAEALDYAHKQSIVHRDIKPGNILFDPDIKQVKITDFGIACMTDDSRTKSGVILGSPSYMSPEQIEGKKLTGRSDLFSLGVTTYQMLTGRLPFVGDSVANLMYKITYEKPDSCKKYRDEISTGLSRAVAKALHKDPDKRYSDGTAMADAFRKYMRG